MVLWPFLSCGFSIKYIHSFIYSFTVFIVACMCCLVIGTCLPIVFSVCLFCEVPFRLFIRSFVSPRVLCVHSRVLRLRLFIHCHSKCFVPRLIGPAPCLSRPGRSRRMPIKVAVCAAFAVPLVSCILKMVHSIDTALEITRVLALTNCLLAFYRTCPVRQANHSRQSQPRALSQSLPYSLALTRSLSAGHLPARHLSSTFPNPHVLHVRPTWQNCFVRS